MTDPKRLPSRVETARLVLRQWTRRDVDPMARAVAESVDHLRPFMAWAALEPVARDERIDLIEGWRAEWEAGGDVVYGVFLEGVPIGGTGLHRRLGPQVLEIGYWIHLAHTRRGYATELSRALTTTAFEHPGIVRVEIHHDEANIASAGIPQRLGFTLVRREHRETTAPAEIGTEWQWAMRKEDWTEP